MTKLFWVLFTLFIVGCSQTTNHQTHTSVPNNQVLSHLYHLSADQMAGRKVGSEGNSLAQQYLIKHLSALGIAPFSDTYIEPFKLNSGLSNIIGKNVVGFIPGTEFANQYIVLSAHYDHIGARGNKIYNGADDNASGTSALLHYAKLIKQNPMRYNVILLFTDGEESNLKGAYAFIEQHSTLLDSIKLNVNVDMLAGSKRTKQLHYITRGLDTILSQNQITALIEQQQHSNIKFRKGFRQKGERLEKHIKWVVASDHGAFYKQGIPFIYYGVGLHKNYHETTDTYVNVNHTFFLFAVEAIYQQISFLDQNL